MSALIESITANLLEWQKPVFETLAKANEDYAKAQLSLVTKGEVFGRRLIEGLTAAIANDMIEKDYLEWAAAATGRSVKTVKNLMTVARIAPKVADDVKATRPSVEDYVILNRVSDEDERNAILSQVSLTDGLVGDARTEAIRLAVNDHVGTLSPEAKAKSDKAKETREGKKIDAGVDFLRPLVLSGLSKDAGQSATLRKYFLAGVNAATSTDPMIGKAAAVLAFDRLIDEGKASYPKA